MRISDWMSDVCSSDLRGSASAAAADRGNGVPAGSVPAAEYRRVARAAAARAAETHSDGNIGPRGIDRPPPDRKRAVSGKSVSVRVDHGGRRNIKTKTKPK